MAFGAGHLSGLSDAEAEALLRGVVERGVTLIDTARGYATSEERIGRYLADQRDAITLSTKVGYGIDGVPDWTPACIRAGIEAARVRLCTDRIDIVHLHSCPLAVLQTPGIIEALLEAREAGHIGAAAYSGDNAELDFALACGQFDVVQTTLNVCDAAAMGKIAAATPRILVKRPLANAPWRFDARPGAPDHATYYDRWQQVADRVGDDPAETALRFAAHAPGVDFVLVGTTRIEHIEAARAAAAKGPLPDAVVEGIRALSAAWPQVT